MRLIDSEKLLKKCIEGDGDDEFTVGYNFAVNEIVEYIKNAPTVDAAPINHGQWLMNNPYGVKVCSLCGYGQTMGAEDYCPNCGAKMR